MEEKDKHLEQLADDYNEAVADVKFNMSTIGLKENSAKRVVKARDLAIKALEKQIPKKPILKNGKGGCFVDYADGHGEYKVTKWQDWVCPVCGWFVGQRYNSSQDHSHDQRKCDYCNNCGQRIDWTEESEEQ